MELNKKYEILERHKAKLKEELKNCDDFVRQEEIKLICEEISKRQFKTLKKIQKGER